MEIEMDCIDASKNYMTSFNTFFHDIHLLKLIISFFQIN